MTVDSWTPDSSQRSVNIDRGFLRRCITLTKRGELEQLPKLISPEEQRQHSAIIRLPESEWSAALADLSSDDLILLIRFFVRAEILLPGWEAGNKSPAIWANKLLKSRGERLSQDELLWIRANTDNRFIPNGSL